MSTAQKYSTSSPLKKTSKKAAQLLDQQIFMQNKKNQFSQPQFNNKSSSFVPDGQKINFQSQDSEGSDISYESSIQSEEDINIGQIQYFKEEMGRFFINYPELINGEIINDQDSHFSSNQSNQFCYQSENKNSNWLQDNNLRNNNGKKQSLNKNWTLIADQILNQAKQSCSFLQSLSRRIALYRSKVEQEDLIDLLLREEKNIMKEIDLELNLKKKESKGIKNNMEHIQGCENMYFSWRKKKEMENRLNLIKDQNVSTRKNKILQYQKPSSSSPNKKLHQSQNTIRNMTNNSLNKTKQKVPTNKISNTVGYDLSSKLGTFFITSATDSINTQEAQNSKANGKQKTHSKTFHRNLERTDSKNFNEKSSVLNGTINRAYSLNKANGKKQETSDKQKNTQNNTIQQQQKQNRFNASSSSQAQTFWKHLVNFQPRTQAGRQLCELIRKTNTPSDQLGIRKTILTFLTRSKEMVQNQIVLKSTISQKIQKLYNDDSKELLMFYPTKMTTIPNQTGNGTSVGGKQQQNKQTGNSIGTNQYEMEGSGQNGRSSSPNTNNLAANYQNLIMQNDLDSNHKLFDEGEKFMKLLEDIVEGPLMKYWMMIQENKL